MDPFFCLKRNPFSDYSAVSGLSNRAADYRYLSRKRMVSVGNMKPFGGFRTLFFVELIYGGIQLISAHRSTGDRVGHNKNQRKKQNDPCYYFDFCCLFHLSSPLLLLSDFTLLTSPLPPRFMTPPGHFMFSGISPVYWL